MTYPPPYRPVPLPPQRNNTLLFSIIGGIAVLLIVGVVVIVKSKHPREVETTEQKYQDASNAFATGSFDSTADGAAIQKAFDSYVVAANGTNAGAIAAFFDTDRVVEEMQAKGFLKDLPRSQRSGFAGGLGQGFSNSIAAQPQELRTKKIEVRSIKPLPDHSEVIAYVRAWNNGGEQLKFRWWLKKDSSGWRFYDMEDLGGGIRLTDAMGAASSGMAGGSLPAWAQQMPKLQTVIQAMASGDVATAESSLDALQSYAFPPEFEALFTVLRGIVKTSKGQFKDGLALYDKAEALHSDLPTVHYLRAIAYNATSQPEKAVASVKKYLSLLGDDAPAYYEMGKAYEALKQPQDAIDAYAKGLADDPNHQETKKALASLKAKGPATRPAATRPATTRPVAQ